jgi:hypothetical protein
VIIRCRDAERLLHEALAETVIGSWLVTGCVLLAFDMQ